MVAADMVKTYSIFRFSVEGSAVGDKVGVSVGVDVYVGVGVKADDGRVCSSTVTNEPRVVCSRGDDVLGSLSTGG